MRCGRQSTGDARTFFGINAQQSAPAGLLLYSAESGFGDARVFVNALYAIGPRWILSAGGAVAHLQGDAADSPLIEDEGYFILNAAVLYRF